MTQYPKELIQIAQAGKKAFANIPESPHPHDCKNCGGLGRLTLFVAEAGPYLEPCPPGKKNVIDKYYLSNHFEEGVGYWYGCLYAYECPICKGEGRHRVTYRPVPMDMMDRLAKEKSA